MTLKQGINKIKRIFGERCDYHIKINYHYFSGFIILPSKNIIYCSSQDDRIKPDYKVLFRKAISLKDYTGGMNHFFDINNITKEKIINTLCGT